MTESRQSGIVRRIGRLLELIQRIRPNLSDAETAGLLKLLPPESGHSLAAFFEPHVREAGLQFLNMLGTWMSNAVGAAAAGKKAILIPFNFPPELVTAFDNAYPITTEVLTTLAAAGLEGGGERYWEVMMGLGLPDHICSANSIELGSMLSGHDFQPAAIISAAPGACDANSKIHEFASLWLNIPQFIIEKPVDDTPTGRRQYEIYYHRLIENLEEFLGEELTAEKLRRVLTRANRCAELYWELWDLHKPSPCPVPNIFSLILAGTRFSMWGADEGVATMEKMVEVAKRRLADKRLPEQRARVLWAYTSYYFDLTGLFTWMEGQGYLHLMDALDLAMPQPIDTSSRESMINGLIDASWNYPMNRQMGSSSMSQAWIEDMIYVAKDLKADCVVYCGHDACKQTWSVVSILRDELRRRANIPTLILHGDSWMSRTTPISVIQKELDDFIRNVVLVGPRRTRQTKRRLARPSGAPVER